MASSLFNVNSVFNKYGIPLQSTQSNPNLINKDQSGMGNISSVAPNRVVPSSQINFFQDSAQRTAELTPPQNRGLLDPTDRNKFKQFGYSQRPTSQQTPQDPRPNVGNNLLSFGKKFTDFAGTPFGTGFAEGVGKFAGYSTMPTSFGQALASGLSSANANELAFLNAQPDRFEQYLDKDGKLMQRNTKTGEVKPVFSKGNVVDLDLTLEAEKTGKNEEYKKYAERISNKLSAIEKQEGEANVNQGRLNQFRTLMTQTDDDNFGYFGNIKKNAMGILQGLDFLDEDSTRQLSNLEAMETISGNFVLGFVQQTKGAISEREMAYFMMISAGIGRTKQGNELILNFSQKINDRARLKLQQVNALRRSEDYLKANTEERDLLLSEFESEFNQKNQIFTEEDKDLIDQSLESNLAESGLTVDFKNQALIQKALQNDDLEIIGYNGTTGTYTVRDLTSYDPKDDTYDDKLVSIYKDIE